MDIAELLKALADQNRLRILHLLAQQTLCVCDLEEVLQLNQSNLSRHLARLKQAGLVSAQKKGLFMYYARKPIEAPYSAVVESLYQSLESVGPWKEDRKRLANRASCVS